MKGNSSFKTIALLLTSLMLISSLIFLPTDVSHAAGQNMTFTTGETISFSTNEEMQFWSGVSMTFTTGIKVQFIEVINGNGMLEACDIISVVYPPGFIMEPCSWWEVLDPLGNPTGFEFHIDEQYGPSEFHIDYVFPGPFPLPVPGINFAEKKIDVIEPCDYYVVHSPEDWWPEPCTWWEIINPESGEPSGFEFHVDWTNESCEFHIDEVTPGPYILPFAWHMVEARQKITEIKPCDWLIILDPAGYTPESCSWWEIMYMGEPTGLEFHVDETGHGTFHVDAVIPDPLKVPPTYPTVARKKIGSIAPCQWYKVSDLTTIPQYCSWWRIISPDMGDVEFHVDESLQDGTFHIDIVYPMFSQPIVPPVYNVVAEKKITTIEPCDWFKVNDPAGWLPSPCSWWKIISPIEWFGVTFHVDATDGINMFHIDTADPLPQGPEIPPWNVTAEPSQPPTGPWFVKPAYPDYAPSGMPDFDQHQDNWGPAQGIYTWCGPTAVANSLWWYDSKYESTSGESNIITTHGAYDDHDPLNVGPVVTNLAFLMDTDGMRTGLIHTGTSYIDMQVGISQYLQQQGINPVGDCDGDGDVDGDDITIINNAMGSMPGAPNWDMAADVVITNMIDMVDLSVAMGNLGLKGMFYEHTEEFPDFFWMEEEIYRCEDVVLFLEFWQDNQGTWMPLYDNPSLEAGHYVTCAGVNSTTIEMLISDPYHDAFEAGLVPGRSPVAHSYPHPPEVHNDTQYVSHDAYPATLWMVPPPSPYGMVPVWELVGYLQALGYDPSWHAFIRAAVVTSPLGEHDIAVTSVTTCKDGCVPKPVACRGYTAHVNVTVINNGDFAESFTVTAYADANVIGSQGVVNLLSGDSITLQFLWNTTGYAIQNYTIIGYAAPVAGESNTGDNTLNGGNVYVAISGDVLGDNKVDMKDIGIVIKAFGAVPGHPKWNPNSDINDDHKIDMKDIGIAVKGFGTTYP